MRMKEMCLILAGAGLVGVPFVIAHRASERRLRALEDEVRAAVQEGQRGQTTATSQAVIGAWAAALATRPALRAMPAPTEPVSSTPPPTSVPRAVGDSPSPDRSEAARAAHVDAVFTQQSADGAWAPGAQQSLGEGLEKLANGAVVESVECKQSLCKAKLTHPDQTQASGFIDRLVAKSAETWRGEIFLYRDSLASDGMVRNSVYFSREGHQMPSFE